MPGKLAFLACAVLCAFVFVLIWFTPRSLVVHDPKFLVLGYQMSTGTNHVMYDGNQTLCRVNQWLRRTTGLDVLHRGGLSVSIPRKTYGFLLRYRGQMNSEELRNLKAFLTAPNGFSVEVQGGASYTSPRAYLKCYLLMDPPTNRGPYSLVLKLPSTGKPVAIWKIGKLH